VDRREFVSSSAAFVLGGAGYGRILEEKPPPVRVAVVGTGGRGTDLIRRLSTLERARLVAICDDYPPHLERAAAAAGAQARPYSRYSRMLAEESPQAVVVATPLHLHLDMCREAIAAGCDVFCEKTMCYSVEQAVELAELVRQRGTVFQVGLQRRANPVYRQAAAMVKTGMLGRVSAIKCQWHRNNNWRRPVPVRRDHPDWDALERRLNWRLYRDSSKGLMAELASHQVDVANWLLGTPPTRVVGTGGIDYWRDGREVFDNVYCIYDYQLEDGEQRPYSVRVTYSSIQNNAFEGASELIMGTTGTLLLTARKGLFYREGGVDDPGWGEEGSAERDAAIITSGKTLAMENDPWAHRGKPLEIDATGDDSRDQLVSFLDHVQRRDPQTICDVGVGVENSASILAGDQAMIQGTGVEFPLNSATGRPTG
jgi:predicted dehydrogenase